MKKDAKVKSEPEQVFVCPHCHTSGQILVVEPTRLHFKLAVLQPEDNYYECGAPVTRYDECGDPEFVCDACGSTISMEDIIIREE